MICYFKINSGIFYEFIDVKDLNKNNSKRATVGNKNLTRIMLWPISSNAGLWSYLIGDTVKFTSLNPLKIKVTGRTKQFISAFGEHVIVEEVDSSLKKAIQKFNEIKIVEYTVIKNIKPKKANLITSG